MHGEYKVHGGKLVVVDLDVRDGRLSDVQVAGDFFLEPDEALEDIRNSIEGLSADLVGADCRRGEGRPAARRHDARLQPGSGRDCRPACLGCCTHVAGFRMADR